MNQGISSTLIWGKHFLLRGFGFISGGTGLRTELGGRIGISWMGLHAILGWSFRLLLLPILIKTVYFTITVSARHTSRVLLRLQAMQFAIRNRTLLETLGYRGEVNTKCDSYLRLLTVNFALPFVVVFRAVVLATGIFFLRYNPSILSRLAARNAFRCSQFGVQPGSGWYLGGRKAQRT